MKVKCNGCSLVLKKCLSLQCICPECGSCNWGLLPIGELDTMSELAKEFLRIVKSEGIKIVKKDVPTMMEVTMKARAKREKEEGLAFEIFDVLNDKRVNIRKIYLDGHIEGFKGNPCIVNHIFPKMQALKYFAQNMNKEYRNLMLKCFAMDFYPVRTLDSMYQKFKETIEKI